MAFETSLDQDSPNVRVVGCDGAESEGQGEAGGQGQGESSAKSGLATFETARMTI